MAKRTWKNYKLRIQYWFDNLMTGGLLPLIVMLFALSFFITLLFALVLYLFGVGVDDEAFPSFLEAFWQSFMHVIDQGTITGEGGWTFRTIMLILTFAGLIFVSTLIGLVSTRISIVLDNLRKGRSLVLEDNHIVILGWSSKIFSVLQELIKANENQDRLVIAILADMDKIDMEDEISQHIKKSRNTKIICRTGNPIDLDELNIINPHQARSVIILSPEDNYSDAQNIKCILAITNHPNREDRLYHIVAEIKTDYNQDIANLIGGDELTLTISNEVIARIAVQTCLQSGLSSVYNKLLDFANVDIYFREIPELADMSFHDTLTVYEDIYIIGLQRPNGIVLLNPRMQTKIKKGDKLILLDRDDDALPKADKTPKPISEDAITLERTVVKTEAKKIFILGWNPQGATIIRELNNYVLQNSEVAIVCDNIAKVEKDILEILPLKNLSYTLKEGDITNRKLLNKLNLQDTDHIMILSYNEQLEVQEADANTLVTLMHLRDIKRQRKASFSIVSEMLDIKNRALAEIAKPDDYIISDHIVSLIISQLAENRELKVVFDELFDSHGCEFYLKPVTLYVKAEEEVDFYTVLEAASRRDEVAIGYRLQKDADNARLEHGVVLNPNKTDKLSFREEDKIIVLAEDF